jgi:hypothetical protein
MNNILIHIGLHKTASSYLQFYYFPTIECINYFHGEIALTDFIRSSKAEHKTALLSNESFSGLAWNAQWKKGIANDFHFIDSFDKCLDNLHRLFPEAGLLIFFRKHGDFLISMYKQYIQEGGILQFNQFYASTGVIRKEDLDYKHRIQKASDLFSKVYVLSYEDFKKYGTAFLDKFFTEELHLQRNDTPMDDRNPNKSISGFKIDLLRKINKVYFKLPSGLTNFLRITRLTPRDILQNKLSFWSPKDADFYKKMKDEANAEMQADWNYFETVKWKYKQHLQ